MSDHYLSLPAEGSPSWKAPVATLGALPGSGNSLGDARVVTANNGVYVWNGTTWTAVGGGGGTPGGSSGDIQYNNAGSFGGVTFVPIGNGGAGLSNAQTDVATTGNITAQAVTTSVLNFTGTALKTLQGMVSNGTAQRVIIRNNGNAVSSMVIPNQSSSASAANRFDLESSQLLTLTPGMEAGFVYNTTSSRWNLSTVRNQVATDGNKNLYSLISGPIGTGSNNLVLGNQAISSGNYAGSNGVIIGYQAGQGLSGSAINNVLIGQQAGQVLANSGGATGSNNVFISTQAGVSATTAYNTVAIGSGAGLALTSGIQNTFIGSSAGSATTTGNYNVAFGLGAGTGHVTGDYNISIGQGSGAFSATNLTNTIAIGAQTRVIASNTGNIGSSGNPIKLGVNQENALFALDAYGDINTNGSFLVNGVAQSPWTLFGNAGTVPGTDFLGTVDYTDLWIYTNGTQVQTLKASGVVGFQKASPGAVVHVGALTGTANPPSSIYYLTNIVASGYAFGSGNKTYDAYAMITVSGVQVFSAASAGGGYTEPSSSGYDPSSAVAQSTPGSGYDPTAVSPPSYQIWAIYVGGAVQSVGAPSVTTDGGSWVDSSQNQNVNVSWAPPASGSPSSYFIVRNGSDYITNGTNSFTDVNSGWLSGSNPGLPDIQYTVGVNWSAASPPNAEGYRVLNSTNVTYLDVAGISASDDGTWASGSTVTPNSADYVSFISDGDSQLQAATFGGDVKVSELTATRVVFAGTDGLLSDDADMTFSSDTLTVANIRAVSELRSGHFIGQGPNAPTIAAGAGAGTSPTVSIAGNDACGAVSVTTGTLPTGTNAAIATITFATAYGFSPYVVLYPANAATATLSGVSMAFVTATTTTFVITSGTTALTAATAYKWNYHVIQ